MKIIGVTKCPTGIAHTYMAAERLEIMGKKLGYEMHIETQGSQGTENELTRKQIAEADYVIIAADVAIEGVERFGGKKVYRTSIKPVLKDTRRVLQEMEIKAEVMEKHKNDFDEGEETSLYTASEGEPSVILHQLMNGASYMIPFVVVGGLFISLSLAFAGESSSSGLHIASVFWNKVHGIGMLAFELMYPILAGFIAVSIAGRAALAPAMIGAMLATDGQLLGTGEGTGFLGCIVVGYLVGYLVKGINAVKVPKAIRPIMPIFVIPLLGVSVSAVLFICILGGPITFAMHSLNELLVYLSESPSTAILLGIVLGAMIGADMGGPINKVAFFFGVASITEGNLNIMGIASAAIGVAPLSMGLAALIGGKKFSKEERGAGVYTIFMGMIGISEGAIPFALSDPGHVIPAVVTGSAVSGAAAAVLGITSAAPHGGPIVGFLGATNHVLLYFLCIALGVFVSTAMVLLTKKKEKDCIE